VSDQTQIADALERRVAQRKRELGLDTPAAEPVAESIAVQGRTPMTCRCGASYLATMVLQAGKPMPWPSSCETCRGTKAKLEAEQRLERAKDAEVRAQASLRQRLADLAVPPKYQDVSLATFALHGSPEDQRVQQRAHGWALRYLGLWPDVQLFSVLQGGYGTGKGHIAWSIAKHLVEELGATARVVKLPALVRELRDTWRKDSATTYDTVLQRFIAPDLLVIDEASRHAFYGQQIHQHLYDVVDTRIELDRPTILTTNEDEEGLAEVLKGALFNRLEGEGGIVPFGTASWRSRPRPEEPEPNREE
jgi:DNA replication protein DnaC